MTARGAIAMTAVAAAMGLTLAGCSSHDTGTTGADSTSLAAAKPWDACSIPDDALRQAGLDPASKKVPIQFSNSTSCRWTGQNVFVYITANAGESVNDIRTKAGNHDFVDVAVTGRQGVMYHESDDDPAENCDLAFPVQTGGVVAFLSDLSGSSKVPTACDETQRIAAALMPVLPK